MATSNRPDESFQTASRPSPRDFVKRQWPWLLLALAAIIFTVVYVPKFFLSTADEETTMLAVFYHDTVEMHHPFSDWGWGGCSDIFPDVWGVFLFNYLTHDGWTALVLVTVVYFVSWLAATAGLAVVLKLPHRLSLFAFILLYWVILICNFALPFDWGLHILNPLFATMYHSSSALLCLVCLVLLIRQISDGWSAPAFCSMFVFAFLGAASDILFQMVFTVPALATLVVLTAASWREWKKHLFLGLNIFTAGALAFKLNPYLFPVQLTTQGYIYFDLQAGWRSYCGIMNDMSREEHRLFAFMGIVDVLTILGCISGVLFYCFSSRRKLISPVVLGLMVFCSSAIFIDWFATIFTGLYESMYSNRYLVVALITPLFLILFAVHAIVQWRPWLEKMCVVVIAIFTIGVAFIPQEAHPDYTHMQLELPFLQKLMKERHIDIGIADYWEANLCFFLSHWQAQLVPVIGDGAIHRGFASMYWFGRGRPANEHPHFRMLYLPDAHFAQVFGPPDEIVYTPAFHSEIWIYSEERAIVYDDATDSLTNQMLSLDHPTIKFIPSALPSDAGIAQSDGTRIAIDGRDTEGFLNGGPVIHLKPAHYRVTFHYTFLRPPAPDKAPIYDILVHNPGDPDKELESGPLPNVGTGAQTFSREFTVDKLAENYETRIRYLGSGTLRLDSLELTYLGPL